MTRTWTMDMDNGHGPGHGQGPLGAGFRPAEAEGEWAGWRDTDKMPPKSPFVPD